MAILKQMSSERGTKKVKTESNEVILARGTVVLQHSFQERRQRQKLSLEKLLQLEMPQEMTLEVRLTFTLSPNSL